MSCFDLQINQKEQNSLSLQEFPSFLIYQPRQSLLALFLLFFDSLLCFFDFHFLQILQKLDHYFNLFFTKNFFRSHYDFFSNLYLKAMMIHQHFQLHHPYFNISEIEPYSIRDLFILAMFFLVMMFLNTCFPIPHYFKLKTFSLLSSIQKLHHLTNL